MAAGALAMQLNVPQTLQLAATTRGVGGWKPPSMVQGQSPGRGSGDKVHRC